MLKKLYVVLFLLLLIPTILSAQRWKRYRYEAVFGLGVSNFLGDLGGADQIGTDYLKDLEMKLTKPTIHIGLRYKMNEYVSNKTGLYFGWVAGDDKLTKEQFRSNRNLSFRTPIIELSTQFEFSWKKEQVGHRYKLRGVRGKKNIEILTYLFGGFGGFYFNPKSKWPKEAGGDGKWHSLRPLHTEGQGLVSTRKPYSPVQFAIPLGIGFKYALDRKWLIGLEISGRKTFTDYIDDVSTTYFDNQAILDAKGPAAAYFADPSLGLNVGQSNPGEQRGDRTDKDVYMFAVFSLNYKLRTGRNNLPSF